ncbi:Glutathione S-transferase-like protein ustS [Pseudocercospora fuligena]|uniref:Glutathione S-transferase-like protein ustS n=1 Tax=Pseudocercospora fuligena TaxID=685502 RepID=A0A8H6RBF8_9PEZI|nr:Glutathione S-transferase-like protein ustS [Pseudocercospora fuligena]
MTGIYRPIHRKIATMSKEVIFYDLPSRGSKPTAWSLNPWKARLVLNYKHIPYKTQWVEYPDLAPTFKSLGIPPNDPTVNPNATYSSPAISLPDGRHIMDSLAIAHELEKLYPSPSLSFDKAEEMQSAVLKVNKALVPIIIPRIPELILNDSSKEYFLETRAKRFGKPLPELARTADVGKCWEDAKSGLHEISALLAGNHDGRTFVLGGNQEPSFADFVLAGFWRFVERVDVDGDLWARLKTFDSKFGRHRMAVAKWLERDD